MKTSEKFWKQKPQKPKLVSNGLFYAPYSIAAVRAFLSGKRIYLPAIRWPETRRGKNEKLSISRSSCLGAVVIAWSLLVNLFFGAVLPLFAVYKLIAFIFTLVVSKPGLFLKSHLFISLTVLMEFMGLSSLLVNKQKNYNVLTRRGYK